MDGWGGARRFTQKSPLCEVVWTAHSSSLSRKFVNDSCLQLFSQMKMQLYLLATPNFIFWLLMSFKSWNICEWTFLIVVSVMCRLIVACDGENKLMKNWVIFLLAEKECTKLVAKERSLLTAVASRNVTCLSRSLRKWLRCRKKAWPMILCGMCICVMTKFFSQQSLTTERFHLLLFIIDCFHGKTMFNAMLEGQSSIIVCKSRCDAKIISIGCWWDNGCPHCSLPSLLQWSGYTLKNNSTLCIVLKQDNTAKWSTHGHWPILKNKMWFFQENNQLLGDSANKMARMMDISPPIARCLPLCSKSISKRKFHNKQQSWICNKSLDLFQSHSFEKERMENNPFAVGLPLPPVVHQWG